MHDPDIEMVEAKAGDMDNERDPCREPQPPMTVIPPEDGQEGSPELQNLPGATNLSRQQVRACKQVEESQVGVAAGAMGRFGKGQEWIHCFQEFSCIQFLSIFSNQCENEDNPSLSLCYESF